MSVTIGSARSDEYGKYVGGTPGDQRQTSAPDYKGEVSRQAFYVHSKGWVILRPKSADHAKKLSEAMSRACDNSNIGYSQSDRLGIIHAGIDARWRVNCDCSSLIRQCVKEATERDPGNFTTANEVTKLISTGLFTRHDYTDGMPLFAGDILVTKTKGHTAIVIEGEKKTVTPALVNEILRGLWGNGAERKRKLTEAGYDYTQVQAAVNAVMPKETPAQHVDQKGIDLIKRFEGCKLTAYRLPGEKYYGIGYGHTSPDILPNMTISQERADEMLRLDLVKYENYVKKYVTDIVLTQNRLNALVSYCYNRGVGKLRDELAAQSHTVKEYSENIVRLWGSNQRYKDALIKRRKAEQELFNS